ncbi:MAG: cation:dicarboxylase symporter family transporter [Vulcanimicrobiota bacterium]
MKYLSDRLAAFTIAGMLAGIVLGLFIGDGTAKLRFIGDIYINLLQMTALPYILFSLVGGIGKLTAAEGRALIRRAGAIILSLWAIGLTLLVLMPLSFPALKTASFFSSSIIEPPKNIDFIRLFVPSNIFRALADNTVPSVVVFSVIAGLALMSMNDKKELITLLDMLSHVMVKINKALVLAAPIGVFAIMAVTAGTMTFEEFGRLQAYLITYTISFLLFVFWILPGLAALISPFRSREILELSRTALVVALTTGKVIIILPIIMEIITLLYERHDLDKEKAASTSEFIIPVVYAFPCMGTILTMLFVPFAAWFSGNTMTASDYLLYIFAGLPSFFGDVTLAIPFCLDLLKLPSDLFQLFLTSGFYTKSLGACLNVMYLIVTGLLVAGARDGILKVDLKRMVFFSIFTAVLIGAAIGGSRMYLDWACQGSYDKDRILKSMNLLEKKAPSLLAGSGTSNPVPLKPGESNLDRMKKRGVIRIGFVENNLPWSYYNNDRELVGFDIEMAHHLARDLGVTIEFVPFTMDSLASDLENDCYDIAMSGIPGTCERTGSMRFSDPYLYIHSALVIPDYRDREFTSLEVINAHSNLKIAVSDRYSPTEKIRNMLDNAQFIIIERDSDFFEGRGSARDADALFTSAEGGSAWTLLYPGFQVATPFPSSIAIPLVYPFLGKNDSMMDEYMDHWILIKTKDGTVHDAYNYWILGRGSQEKKHRWSIARDVLHWVK